MYFSRKPDEEWFDDGTDNGRDAVYILVTVRVRCFRNPSKWAKNRKMFKK